MNVDFEKHKQSIESDPNRVRCAHCGAWIATRADRCPKCGVYFKGEAFQFVHRSDELEAERRARARRLRIVGAVIALLFLLGILAFSLQ